MFRFERQVYILFIITCDYDCGEVVVCILMFSLVKIFSFSQEYGGNQLIFSVKGMLKSRSKLNRSLQLFWVLDFCDHKFAPVCSCRVNIVLKPEAVVCINGRINVRHKLIPVCEKIS